MIVLSGNILYLMYYITLSGVGQVLKEKITKEAISDGVNVRSGTHGEFYGFL